MTAPPASTAIRRALSDLAEHAHRDGGIAAHLAAERDLGRRRAAYSCPVAVHLRRVTGAPVIIGDDAWHCRPFGGDHARWGELPQEVAEFVEAFDAGVHPELNIRLREVAR